METQTTSEYGPQIYDLRYAYGYDWTCYEKLGRHLIDLMKKSGAVGKKIIDIGCGTAWLTDCMYFNISRNIKGIDFSKKAVMFHAWRMYPAFETECTDIYKHDYTGYEVAVLTEVLEHLGKDVELLGKIPAGCMVYATVPFEKERLDQTHVREYTLVSIRERYENIIDIKYLEKVDQFIVIHGVRK